MASVEVLQQISFSSESFLDRAVIAVHELLDARKPGCRYSRFPWPAPLVFRTGSSVLAPPAR